MKVPQLKQCCCGCTLETGSLIIGWLDLILCILGMLSYTYILVAGTKDHNGVAPSTVSGIVMIISMAIHALISIILLIGIRRRLQKYVHIWVVVTTLGLVMMFFFTLVQSISTMAKLDAASGAISLVAGLISIAIYTYLTLVVHSFSRELIAEQQHV